MLRPRSPQPVKFIVALQSADADLARRARHLLVRRLGVTDAECPWVRSSTPGNLDASDSEAALLLSFGRLYPPGRLVEVVHESFGIETEIADDCLLPDATEPVLIQPGYIDLTKLILGSTRDAPQRVFLGSSTYGELTMQHNNDDWKPLPWTGAEWCGESTRAFLRAARERLIAARDGLQSEPDTSPFSQ